MVSTSLNYENKNANVFISASLAPMKRPTRTRGGAPGIIDVANRAGVSPATVSRFFNSPDLLGAKTRARVQVAATELGYIRDRMASAMHNRFSGTVGLVVPTINNTIFSELIAAFSNRLLEHDRTMLVASHNYDQMQEASIIRSLLERKIDGIALVGQHHQRSAIDMLQVRSVPVIAVWGYHPETSIPFVGADNCLAAKKVTQHLIDLGHSDIAFIFPDTENNDRAAERMRGVQLAMQTAGLSIPAKRLHTCPYNIAQSKATAIDLLLENKPTAVVCCNDVIAHGVIYAAQQLKMTLPDELSVVGIGDFTGSADIVPSLTTVRLPANQIGRIAADGLVHMSENGEQSHFENRVIDTELIVRESSGCPV
jgi:LacI family transcriptional regulator